MTFLEKYAIQRGLSLKQAYENLFEFSHVLLRITNGTGSAKRFLNELNKVYDKTTDTATL